MERTCGCEHGKCRDAEAHAAYAELAALREKYDSLVRDAERYYNNQKNADDQFAEMRERLAEQETELREWKKSSDVTEALVVMLNAKLASAERVVDAAARRFRPLEGTPQWERREFDLADVLEAYDAGGAVKEKGEKL